MNSDERAREWWKKLHLQSATAYPSDLAALLTDWEREMRLEGMHSFFWQHNIVVWQRPASWRCHCGRWALDSKLNDECVMRKSWAEHCVEEFALLAAPVAPPPTPKLLGAQKHLETCTACNHGRTPCSEYRRNYENDSAVDGLERTDGPTGSMGDESRAGRKEVQAPPLAPGVQSPRNKEDK